MHRILFAIAPQKSYSTTKFLHWLYIKTDPFIWLTVSQVNGARQSSHPDKDGDSIQCIALYFALVSRRMDRKSETFPCISMCVCVRFVICHFGYMRYLRYLRNIISFRIVSFDFWHSDDTNDIRPKVFDMFEIMTKLKKTTQHRCRCTHVVTFE